MTSETRGLSRAGLPQGRAGQSLSALARRRQPALCCSPVALRRVLRERPSSGRCTLLSCCGLVPGRPFAGCFRMAPACPPSLFLPSVGRLLGGGGLPADLRTAVSLEPRTQPSRAPHHLHEVPGAAPVRCPQPGWGPLPRGHRLSSPCSPLFTQDLEPFGPKEARTASVPAALARGTPCTCSGPATTLHPSACRNQRAEELTSSCRFRVL